MSLSDAAVRPPPPPSPQALHPPPKPSPPLRIAGIQTLASRARHTSSRHAPRVPPSSAALECRRLRCLGLTLFSELPGRRSIRALCGGSSERPCGVGAMDGRIQGWKQFGELKLSQDCLELRQVSYPCFPICHTALFLDLHHPMICMNLTASDAWAKMSDGRSERGMMPLMRRTHERLSASLSCELGQRPSSPES